MNKLNILAGLLILFSIGCNGSPSGPGAEPYDPVIDPVNFVTTIDNQYFLLTPGTTFHYEGETSEGTETNRVHVTNETRVITGVTCVVVADSVWLEGELIEATFDWYAQDNDGAVWYFGEDSKELENGVVVSTVGSWESGVDGAKPGIVMEANPQVGDSYRQEYYKGEAEDKAEVVGLSESVSVPYGSFANCLKTREFTRLEPNVEENKYYAPGVGLVLEVGIRSGARVELVGITTE